VDSLDTPWLFRDAGVVGLGTGLGFPRLVLKPLLPMSPDTFFTFILFLVLCFRVHSIVCSTLFIGCWFCNWDVYHTIHEFFSTSNVLHNLHTSHLQSSQVHSVHVHPSFFTVILLSSLFTKWNTP
jgi:hypothetical protein